MANKIFILFQTMIYPCNSFTTNGYILALDHMQLFLEKKKKKQKQKKTLVNFSVCFNAPHACTPSIFVGHFMNSMRVWQ